MIKKLLRKWFKKWHHNHYCNSHTYKWRQKHINKENPKRNYEKYNYDFVYVKKDCSDKKWYIPPFSEEHTIICSVLNYYKIHSKYSWERKICSILSNVIDSLFYSYETFWIKKNNLCYYWEREYIL